MKLGQVVHPSILQAEVDGSLCVQGQFDLHCKFEVSQDYTVKPCQK